jgi:hypothetical protein
MTAHEYLSWPCPIGPTTPLSKAIRCNSIQAEQTLKPMIIQDLDPCSPVHQEMEASETKEHHHSARTSYEHLVKHQPSIERLTASAPRSAPPRRPRTSISPCQSQRHVKSELNSPTRPRQMHYKLDPHCRFLCFPMLVQRQRDQP